MVDSWSDLEVYKSAFALQQALYVESKSWPKSETYSLIDQIRRSSRSVGANIAEAWARRRYPQHFLAKLADSDGELQETIHWIETALASEYLSPESAESLLSQANRIGKQLGS